MPRASRSDTARRGTIDDNGLSLLDCRCDVIDRRARTGHDHVSMRPRQVSQPTSQSIEILRHGAAWWPLRDGARAGRCHPDAAAPMSCEIGTWILQDARRCRGACWSAMRPCCACAGSLVRARDPRHAASDTGAAGCDLAEPVRAHRSEAPVSQARCSSWRSRRIAATCWRPRTSGRAASCAVGDEFRALRNCGATCPACRPASIARVAPLDKCRAQIGSALDAERSRWPWSGHGRDPTRSTGTMRSGSRWKNGVASRQMR